MPRSHGVEVPTVGCQRHAEQRREDAFARSLGRKDPIELTHPLVAAKTGERQRPPADAQGDPERGLVGPVACDVADHHVDGAVRRLDDVEEVPADQGVLPARP